jgi:hypothetical protein
MRTKLDIRKQENAKNNIKWNYEIDLKLLTTTMMKILKKYGVK